MTQLNLRSLADKAHATEQPDGRIVFRSWLDLAVFRHHCNRQQRAFDHASSEPARPVATLHVGFQKTEVEWTQGDPPPDMGSIEVYDRPAQDQRDAERYRWLRNQWCNGTEETGLEPIMHATTEAECDAAIDAASKAAGDSARER